MKLYFVVNARVPTKKGYGIHIAKMCEAFLASGAELTLVIPRTRASQNSVKEFYGLTREVRTIRIPALDWYDRGRAAFALSSLSFALMGLFWLWGKRISGTGVVYTTDMDTFTFAFLPFAGFPVWSEMHDWRGDTPRARSFFRRARGIIATNTETANRLKTTFHLNEHKVIVEPNGVNLDLARFAPSREEARKQLGISPESRVALYLGRFYAWKGLGILTDAARRAPELHWYVVGGTRDEFEKESGVSDIPDNLLLPGECTLEETALWYAAADALLVLGTKENEQSYRHTAPMKVYEYMAAERPLVASATPALKSFVEEHEAYWYEPDDAASLVEATLRAIDSNDAGMLARAAATAGEHSWQKRAERILAFMRHEHAS